MLFDKSYETRDRKMQHVCMMICNYMLKNVTVGRVYSNTWEENEYVDLQPIYDYISENNIVICRCNKNSVPNMDTRDDAGIERFILSYIYFVFECENDIKR